MINKAVGKKPSPKRLGTETFIENVCKEKVWIGNIVLVLINGPRVLVTRH